MSKRERKGSWVVRMRATVTKDVVVENCTETEARENPFDHAVSEEELEQYDYKVLEVTSNE